MVRVRLPSREAKTLGFFVANYLSLTGAGSGLVGELFDFWSFLEVGFRYLQVSFCPCEQGDINPVSEVSLSLQQRICKYC
jgi:hypothetical protein